MNEKQASVAARIADLACLLAGVNYPDRLTTTILAGWGRA